jgi:hypothetical protein
VQIGTRAQGIALAISSVTVSGRLLSHSNMSSGQAPQSASPGEQSSGLQGSPGPSHAAYVTAAASCSASAQRAWVILDEEPQEQQVSRAQAGHEGYAASSPLCSETEESLISGYSAHNPVPSATTLSHGDGRAYQAEATGHACMSDDVDEAASLLSNVNPMVTPATSDTASVQAPDNLYLDRYLACGLPTVDEVPKAPPDYLPGSGRAHEGRPGPEKHRDAGGSDVEGQVEGDAQHSGMTEPVHDQASAEQEQCRTEINDASRSSAASRVGSDDAQADHLAHAARRLASVATSSSQQALQSSSAHPISAAPQAQDASEEACEQESIEAGASLEEYERRLEEAQGRTFELTEYLTQLQEWKGEVWSYWGGSICLHSDLLVYPTALCLDAACKPACTCVAVAAA